MVDDALDVVGYFDYGSGTGAAPTHLIDGILDKDRLGHVLCRGVVETPEHASKISTAFPGGRRVPQLMGSVLNVIPYSKPRLYLERIFDWIVSRRLVNDYFSGDFHYHHTPGHLRSIRKANDLGKTTVLAGAVELTQRSIKRYEEECKRHGLSCHVPTELRRAATRRFQTLVESDQILAMSSFAAESYVDGGIDRDSIDIVPLGVDTERFDYKPLLNDDKFRVTFVGSVNVLKGIPYLLDAWKLSGLGEDDKAELRLCGHVADEIEPLLEDGPTNVSTPGFVDPVPEYRQASVFAFPSLSEGFAKAPLEAMSTGRPIIVTENAGTPDIMNDGEEGIVVSPRNAEELANALNSLRENSTERKRMGQAARNTAERYTWERYTNEVTDKIIE
ncbi:glycosyltransferase family 4 protein [Halorubrum sp. CGM5_25_10-8B]|uniref:glycosyltransferase family 4 protein n=1 Tax=Halorubrum sp. CGM5_25_10-8B TaxID=2518115 RepID=UPI00130EDF5B|nr:glycosyltransferase [Halorubrum sp. CGM5_25_10-8B]